MPAVQSRHSESPLHYTGWGYYDDVDGGSSQDYAEISQREVRTHLQWQSSQMGGTKQLEHGSDGIREVHPTTQFQSTWNMDKITCPWKVVLDHSLSESHHHTLSNRTVRYDTSIWQQWHKKWQTTVCGNLHKRAKKIPNPRTETLFSIHRKLQQGHDFELGPPEEPHGINHGHHLHTSDQSWRNRDFGHSSSCTVSTTRKGIPFLIPLPACCSYPVGILQSPSGSSSWWKASKFGVVVKTKTVWQSQQPSCRFHYAKHFAHVWGHLPLPFIHV